MRNLFTIFFIFSLVPSIWAQSNSPYKHLTTMAKDANAKDALSRLEKEKVDDDGFYLAAKGEILMHYGQYQKAENSLLAAIELFGKNSGQYQAEMANSYSQLGILYWNLGKTNLASDQLYSALVISEKIKTTYPVLWADIQNNLGLVLSAQQTAKAITHYQEALEQYRLGNLEEKKAQTLINIGIVKQTEGDFKDALTQLDIALKIIERLYSERHPTAAFILSLVGQTYAMQADHELALYYYKESREIWTELYGKRHPEISNLYILEGDLYLKKHQYRQALDTYQQALIANSQYFDQDDIYTNPTSHEGIKAINQLYALLRKADAFEQYYHGHSLHNKHLKAALTCIATADSIVQNLRIGTYNKQDALQISEAAYQLYESAQSIAAQLSKGTINKQYYLSIAFQYAEKGKAAGLQNAIAETEARKFGDIDDTMLNKEDSLRTTIAYFEIQLSNSTKTDESLTIRNQLNQARSEYALLIKTIEKTYPKYYELKHTSQYVTLANIQDKLSDGEIILSYNFIEHQNEIYLYLIDKKRISLYNISQADNVRRLIRGFRNALQFQLKREFIELSTQLGEQLMPFAVKKKWGHTYILADGELSKIPFEALIVRKENTQEYHQQDYLLNKLSVSYNFSAQFVAESLGKNETPIQTALLMAPVDFGYFFTGIGGLPASKSEINKIAQLFSNQEKRTTILTENKATKNAFLISQEQKFDLIHLATHAKIFENNPENSRLYLSPKNQRESDFIYANEIYNWRLDSKLVCLSACETALGKLSRGEGIIGFTRAFTYAGAENILVSLWPVMDESTALLMENFYKQLLTDNTSQLSSALRTAKIQVLQQSDYKAPYYWAPFTLFGK